MKHMKSLLSLTLALAMALTLLPGAALAAEESAWADGTYQGTGKGYGGDVVMEVVIEDGAIRSVTPVSHDGENFWVVYETELNEMIEAIRAGGSTDVDAVSGATASSRGIKEAVDEALKRATGWTPEPPRDFDPSFFASGTGEEDNPWTIETTEQLQAFAVSMTEAEGGDYLGRFVRLDADLDLAGVRWTPIGEHVYAFQGTFDGNGHTVSHMTVGSDSEPATADVEGYWAFFSILGEEGTIRDLTLKDISINVASEIGLSAAGVAAVVTNSDNTEENLTGGVIDHCTVTGSIRALQDPGQSNLLAGGVTSYLYKGAIINCVTDVELEGAVQNGGGWFEAGGITGMNNRGLVANCCSLGSVRGSADQSDPMPYAQGMSIIGGLAGFHAGTSASCYTRGGLTAEDRTRGFGLLAGYMTMGNLYDSWFSGDAAMLNAGDTVDPKPVGASMPAYRSGLYYVEGVKGDLNAFSADEYTGLADKLNEVLKAYPVEIEQYGVGSDALNQWVVRGGLVIPDGGSVEAPYVRSAAEYVYPEMKSLEDAIAEAKSKDGGDYTDESWAPVPEALAQAETALAAADGDELSEETVAAMAKAAEDLRAALDALEEKPAEDDGALAAAYAVTTSAEHGRVTVNHKYAEENVRVTVTVKADEGYALSSLTAEDRRGNEVALTEKDGAYTFRMPASRVTVTGVFSAVKAEPAQQDDPCEAFEDVDTNAWYHEAVDEALTRGLMNGVSDTSFAPDGAMSRAMIVTMLWRLENAPKAGDELPFDDVSETAWYGEAVRWAASVGLAKGVSETRFAPDAPVDRQQLAAFLYRYAQLKGQGFTGLWAFELDFADADQVADFAREPMCWLTMKGVITGSDGRLSPAASASRAQAAQMLVRLLSELEK